MKFYTLKLPKVLGKVIRGVLKIFDKK
ncbi:stage V sporulation protein SpoVM [Natranaerofaba carboxydovora]